MNDHPAPTSHLVGDQPAASSPQGRADRGELALIAVERTHMPMVVSDARQPDNPIVLANRAFLDLSGYTADEVIGRNCRFLQGPQTDPLAIGDIRTALRDEREITLELINYRKNGEIFYNQLHISPIHDDEGRLLYFFASQRDVTAQYAALQAERNERILRDEINHRANNVMAVTQAIIAISHSDDPGGYAKAVRGRVKTLAQAHALLAENHWANVPLEQVLSTQLQSLDSARVTLSGPEISVPADMVQPIALVAHEMAVNALVHGAMATGDGQLSVTWQCPTPSDIQLYWLETGGQSPPARPRHKAGLAIVNGLLMQLAGRAEFNWANDGLKAKLHIPVRLADRP